MNGDESPAEEGREPTTPADSPDSAAPEQAEAGSFAAQDLRGKRIKYLLLLGSLVLSGLSLIAWTQQWFVLTIEQPGPDQTVPVDGSVAAPALAALALAGLALSAALAIAGPVFRVVLGILAAVIGGCITLSSAIAVGNPVAAGESVVTNVTGIAGSNSVAALVSGVTTTPWPVVTLVIGILLLATGLAVAATTKMWPASGRKYQAVRLESADHDRRPDAVDSWDELTRGDDPTQ